MLSRAAVAEGQLAAKHGWYDARAAKRAYQGKKRAWARASHPRRAEMRRQAEHQVMLREHDHHHAMQKSDPE